jgi:hypothetical protein
MLLLRFLHAMIGAAIGAIIFILYYHFYAWPRHEGDLVMSMLRLIQAIVYCMILSIAISSGIALLRKYLLLEMGSLSRLLFGFFLLELPALYIELEFYKANPFALNSFIAPLAVGGLAGLFYGNISPKDQDWRLSKTFAVLNWIIGKRGDEVTSLSLGQKDKHED